LNRAAIASGPWEFIKTRPLLRRVGTGKSLISMEKWWRSALLPLNLEKKSGGIFGRRINQLAAGL
jgi:hypothetical protein